MELFVKILTNVFGNATIILGLVALFGCLAPASKMDRYTTSGH